MATASPLPPALAQSAAGRRADTRIDDRAGGLGAGRGGAIPFASARAARLAANDPRPAIEERWPDNAAYLATVRASTARLMAERLLLAEDAQAMVPAAEAGTLARLPR